MKNNNKSNKKSKAILKPLGKRWFVAASGWGLSLDAGSDNPQTRQQKREIPIPMDSKMYNDGSIVANTSFLHNTVYTANPLNGIVYSNLDNGRVGDFIHIKQMSLKFSLDTASNTTVSTPIIVRCMLVVVTDESTQAAFGSGIGSTSVFSQYTTSQLIAARVDPKLCKVLCDYLAYVTPTSTSSGFQVHHVECPVNSDFEFRTNTQTGTAANLYWLLIPSISGGTTGTTKVANLNYDYATVYTDRP